MKKIFYLFFLLVSGCHFAQGTVNRFQDTEKESTTNEAEEFKTTSVESTPNPGPGNPGSPIDDYLPILILTATGIIIYTARKKKDLFS